MGAGYTYDRVEGRHPETMLLGSRNAGKSCCWSRGALLVASGLMIQGGWLRALLSVVSANPPGRADWLRNLIGLKYQNRSTLAIGSSILINPYSPGSSFIRFSSLEECTVAYGVASAIPIPRWYSASRTSFMCRGDARLRPAFKAYRDPGYQHPPTVVLKPESFNIARTYLGFLRA